MLEIAWMNRVSNEEISRKIKGRQYSDRLYQIYIKYIRDNVIGQKCIMLVCSNIGYWMWHTRLNSKRKINKWIYVETKNS